MSSITPHLPEAVKRLPVLRTLRDKRHAARFLSPQGTTSSYGVFASFEEARAWLPPSPGFDLPALADEHIRVRMHRVFAYDYPVIHWLTRAFAEGADSVLDLGGSIGVHFHAYRDRLAYPDTLRWTVWEVPALAQLGREMAARDGIRQLRFIDTLAPADRAADIWLASGALQYMESAQPETLLAGGTLPRLLLLNKLPLYDGDEFITVQNIGEHAFAPYRVYNRGRLVASIESHGYRLADAWGVYEHSLYLPGHPERSFDSLSGLCFRRTGRDTLH